MSKDKYKVSNWKAYNEGLKRRGSITLWIQDDIAQQWNYVGKKQRGGQYRYSNAAVELCLILHKVYSLPLRQTQGFIKSLFEQRKIEVVVPDYTTMSRRSSKLSVSLSASRKRVSDIVMDSTGLKVYGEGEWKVRKYGAGKHRTWMKLHIAIDEQSQEIEAVTLSTNATDDASEVEPLLKQIEQPVRSFRGDGGYDKSKVRKQLHGKKIEQIIPPQHNAVVNKKAKEYLQQRDQDIQTIKKAGREEWKKQKRYHQRSKVETAMFRYKLIVGNTLSARKEDNQKTEVKIGCKILNITLQTTKPKSFKVA